MARRGLADGMHPLADAKPDLEEVVAGGLVGFCTATSPPDIASLPYLPALPLVTPSPATDELARLLLAHHNPFHLGRVAVPAYLRRRRCSLGGPPCPAPPPPPRRVQARALTPPRWMPPPVHGLRAGPYDAVVDALGRARQFDATWRVVVDASADGAASPRMVVVLETRYVTAGMTRQAIRTFDNMEAFVGRELDASEFATLLETLCKYKSPKVRDDETCSCMLADKIII
ncbi:hypothetical protein SETIT_3G089600v2 [Setaria italica]|uniref:Uncharacterized protein n=1 Tax=Setaria italica TaxID=4555 RepID=K3ZD51_SETIT|nr:hypothetical protein SETIT_3G089600v2 [Setaria italica]